jgi:hypothetical protein
LLIYFCLGGLSFFIKIEDYGEVFQFLFELVKTSSPGFNGGNLFQLFFSGFWIIPEFCSLGFIFLKFDQGKLRIDVKDTSPGRWCALLTL